MNRLLSNNVTSATSLLHMSLFQDNMSCIFRNHGIYINRTNMENNQLTLAYLPFARGCDLFALISNTESSTILMDPLKGPWVDSYLNIWANKCEEGC